MIFLYLLENVKQISKLAIHFILSPAVFYYLTHHILIKLHIIIYLYFTHSKACATMFLSV